jgi:hypothetical protein
MPLTKSGKEVLSKMKKEYGNDKGEEVFYASINKKKKGSEGWHRKKMSAVAKKIINS